MKTKFTPGPWIMEDERFVYALNEKGTNRFHASIAPGHIPGYDSEETQKANAYLIAAAPDLFEAAQQAKKYLEPNLVEPGRTVFWNLVNAINKALGK